MAGLLKVVLAGLADPRQALEAGRMGIDGAVVALDGAPPLSAGPALPTVSDDTARRIARALPPLAARIAVVPPGAPLPPGFHLALTTPAGRPPAGAGWIVQVPPHVGAPEDLPAEADALWIPPAPDGTSSATRFDFTHLERVGRQFRTFVEVPDGAAGLETVARLARPYAVLLGEAAWYRAGIVDLDRLEDALGVVARLNKSAF